MYLFCAFVEYSQSVTWFIDRESSAMWFTVLCFCSLLLVMIVERGKKQICLFTCVQRVVHFVLQCYLILLAKRDNRIVFIVHFQ